MAAAQQMQNDAVRLDLKPIPHSSVWPPALISSDTYWAELFYHD